MARPVLATIQAAQMSRHMQPTRFSRAVDTAIRVSEPVSGPVQFVLRPYTYADGKAYRENLKLIKVVQPDGSPSVHNVGGAVILRDKAIAFATKDGGAVALVQGSIRDIIAHADAYAWGSTLREAVEKIRPRLPGAEPAPASVPAVSDKPAREKIALGNFAGMLALFDAAKAKKSAKAFQPKVRLMCEGETIVLSVAGSTAMQPGTINVATPGGFNVGKWFGRITREGEFEINPREKVPAALFQTLREFSHNPLGTMVSYGRLLGQCSICARTLQDPVSIERGIGPICAAKFGF